MFQSGKTWNKLGATLWNLEQTACRHPGAGATPSAVPTPRTRARLWNWYHRSKKGGPEPPKSLTKTYAATRRTFAITAVPP